MFAVKLRFGERFLSSPYCLDERIALSRSAPVNGSPGLLSLASSRAPSRARNAMLASVGDYYLERVPSNPLALYWYR